MTGVYSTSLWSEDAYVLILYTRGRHRHSFVCPLLGPQPPVVVCVRVSARGPRVLGRPDRQARQVFSLPAVLIYSSLILKLLLDLRSSIQYNSSYISSTWLEAEQAHAIIFADPSGKETFDVVADIIISATGPSLSTSSLKFRGCRPLRATRSTTWTGTAP